MDTHHKGSCLCGSVRYELSGQFQSFFLCHCTRCQKDTGSAHAANLFAPKAQLTWTQGEHLVTHYRYPDSLHVKSFCQVCGSALPHVAEELGCVMVPAGSLDSPVTLSPTAKIFVESAAPWTKDLASVPSFKRLPES